MDSKKSNYCDAFRIFTFFRAAAELGRAGGEVGPTNLSGIELSSGIPPSEFTFIPWDPRNKDEISCLCTRPSLAQPRSQPGPGPGPAPTPAPARAGPGPSPGPTHPRARLRPELASAPARNELLDFEKKVVFSLLGFSLFFLGRGINYWNRKKKSNYCDAFGIFTFFRAQGVCYRLLTCVYVSVKF